MVWGTPVTGIMGNYMMEFQSFGSGVFYRGINTLELHCLTFSMFPGSAKDGCHQGC